jgi:hypothetical protein
MYPCEQQGSCHKHGIVSLTRFVYGQGSTCGWGVHRDLALPEVTLLVGPQVCKDVDIVQVPAVSHCPRGGLKDFGLLPSCPAVPLGLC